MDITALVAAQRRYFESDATKPLAMRQAALTRLLQAVAHNEDAIAQALHKDLGKDPYESYITETSLAADEIRFARSHLSCWMRPRRVLPSISQMPADCQVISEPYGVTLIMAPWNYPFQLTMIPLAAALSAGNCVIIKPSAYAPATSQLVADIIAATFRPEYVAVIQGGRQENTELLKQRFDYIFFTGSVEVGKLVMADAAANLTPVTLELGGKRPCIIDATADIDAAARRIVFGKLVNAGQTCVAPDYCWVDARLHDLFIAALKRQMTLALGEAPLTNPEYPHIVNAKHYQRIMGLIDPGKTVHGGQGDGVRIAPTIIDGAGYGDACMQQEIFGPVLPVMSYHDVSEAIAAIKAHPQPLACYIFTSDPGFEQRLLSSVSFGGGCVNDTLLHLSNPRMPFGGVGASGMGHYHGRYGFDTFSHQKSVVRRMSIIDDPLRYHPYTPLKNRITRFLVPLK